MIKPIHEIKGEDVCKCGNPKKKQAKYCVQDGHRVNKLRSQLAGAKSDEKKLSCRQALSNFLEMFED